MSARDDVQCDVVMIIPHTHVARFEQYIECGRVDEGVARTDLYYKHLFSKGQQRSSGRKEHDLILSVLLMR